jgi:hypothetical protein
MISLNDVVIGQQETVGSKEYSRARTFSPASACAQIDHRRTNSVRNVHDHTRKCIERFALRRERVAGRRRFRSAAVRYEMLPKSRHGLLLGGVAFAYIVK